MYTALIALLSLAVALLFSVALLVVPVVALSALLRRVRRPVRRQLPERAETIAPVIGLAR
ncbi:MAG TPA: hypothetical protein VHG72_12190 [Polyangia bacterium]|nr:hypothetical protein [Polyangia bacterium]